MVFLVGNKNDLESNRVVTFDDGNSRASALSAHFHEVSAKTGYGIDDFFVDIAKSYLERAAAKQQETTPKVDLQVAEDAGKKNGGCCH
jgi:GTPase SAR1 family protein